MRKNGLTGPIPNAGRKVKDKSMDAILNVRISKEARQALETIDRMQRGNYISNLILQALPGNDLI